MVRSLTDNTEFDACRPTDNVDRVIVPLPEGTDRTMLRRDSAEFCRAMVSAIAKAVAVHPV